MSDLSTALDRLPDRRLAALEAIDVAHRLALDCSRLRRSLDLVTARIENALTERVLMHRLRKGLARAGDATSAGTMLAALRQGYTSRGLETHVGAGVTSARQPSTRAGDEAMRLAGNARACLLYCPGGGFILPPSRRQREAIADLAARTGLALVLCDHRLAPEHPFPTAIEDVVAHYVHRTPDQDSAAHTFLGADTAGASIMMGALLTLRERGHPMPAGIILFSPWCDLTLSGWSYIAQSARSTSPFRMETAAFCARLYMADADPRDARASAIFAELHGLPPLLIFTSRDDLHFDDAVRLAENGREADRSIRLNYWDTPRHQIERLGRRERGVTAHEVSRFVDRNLH